MLPIAKILFFGSLGKSNSSEIRITVSNENTFTETQSYLLLKQNSITAGVGRDNVRRASSFKGASLTHEVPVLN